MKMDKKALTLVEVLISTAIFAMIIIGVTGVFVLSVEMSKRINYEYAATNIAKSKIERLKYTSYSLLPDASETDTRVDADGKDDESGEYIRNTTVTANYGGNTHLTFAEVEVTYYYKGSEVNAPARMTYLFTDIK